jgi:MFS family permease
VSETVAAPTRRFGTGAIALVCAGAILLLLGWNFIADPSLSAPTRDPAWYTWRAQVILDADPGSVTGEWGPFVGADPAEGKAGTPLLSGGYRVTTPLAGALLQRVAGIDKYSFSAFLMLGIPVLTGLAFAAGAYRSRKHWLVIPMSILAAAALFMTTPYVGYLDNITVLFLLALTFPFLGPARTHWGARIALILIGAAAAFTHPTTCVLFGLTMLGVFGFHVLTSRFHLAPALKSDGPALMSVGFGMVGGLACWVLGIWGVVGNLNDAALPPPYTKAFFMGRLGEWVFSLQPQITVPLLVFAVVSTILLARRRREPADAYDIHAAWWMFPFIGIATVLTGAEFDVAGVDPGIVPYYRFMNATAAPMALVGLGAFAAIMWFWRDEDRKLGWAALTGGLLIVWSLAWLALGGLKGNFEIGTAIAFALLGLLAIVRPLTRGTLTKVVAVLAAIAIGGSLAWMFWYGIRPANWVSEKTQWANQQVRASLVAVNEVVAAAGDRANVLVMNYNDADDPETQANTAYGWAKTYTNVFRTGLPGERARNSVTYLGTVENFLAGERTEGASVGYDRASTEHFDELGRRLEEFPTEPVVFLIGQYYGGLCNGGACPADDPDTEVNEKDEAEAAALQAALDAGQAVEVGPDVYVLTGDGLWTPPAEVVDRAHERASAEAAFYADHPSAFENPLHTLSVLLGLFVLAVLPGLLAMRFFGADSGVAKAAIVPGMSVVMTLLAGIVVLSVWRGPLTTTKGWVVAAVAVGLGALFGFAGDTVLKPFRAFAGFFDKLFSQFSNVDFAVLMGVQFLAQMGQGVVQGTIAKSLAFGGEQGFDVQNLPSARYLLTVVLFLYLPYVFISPVVGVFIDRFPRRRVVWVAALVTAITVIAVSLFVLAPLGDGTTEGKVFSTAGLILALIGVQTCVRVTLAVKSAAMPDVLSGRDLLQGNSLSQAGGGFFQLVGIAVGGVAAGILPPFIPAIIGAAVFIVAGIVAKRLHHAELSARETSLGREVAQVFRNVGVGLREVWGRAAAKLGLASFQMVRYQFWGFNLFVFGLYAKYLVSSGDAESLSLALSGVGGLVGAAAGIVIAQKLKDRVPPARLMISAMIVMGVGTLIGGLLLSVAGFALMLAMGFFSFFLGKVSADTVVQQAMPDDFRGRAFALFDIAYNLGFIVPAIILYFVFEEGSAGRTRSILLVSGVVFLVLTFLIAAWARRIKDELAPQDDLIGEEAEELAAIED